MSSGQHEAAQAKVLETQRTQESASENEETDSITDHSSKSSTAQQQQKLQHAKSATQFSVVQRSDSDGLRMKISAIRPPTTTQSSSLSSSSVSAAIGGAGTTAAVTAPIGTAGTTSLKKGKELKQTKQSQKMSAPMLAHLSDANESGCSEATTITTATGINVARNSAKGAAATATKKIKVKRKKIAHSNSNSKSNANKQGNSKKARIQTAFSSDSEDDLPLKIHQQRAPRLLLTAIGASGTPALASDHNIGISSSDNELPDLVKAAIKRVESDTEDTTMEGSFRKAAKSKHLPQYQSTLLQDFMEKSQMVGQSASARLVAVPTSSASINVSVPSPALASSQSGASVTSSASRKRRGRPKKLSANSASTSIATMASTIPQANNMGINESVDSGVISTASTTQSTTPSPKMPSTAPVNNENLLPATTSVVAPSKPMAYLDKHMYATERVLYPPPRNKRRQSAKKSNKEELQIDPVWREIDVNKKFRLSSVSGYKSDGGGGHASNTICSKVLAAKSGYVSDYGSVRHQRSQHAHNSGYKSDASCKSRYSTKSCMSRRSSRAKSCGYRSDCKESSSKSGSRLRRRRRASMLLKNDAKSTTNPTDEQDILQLAGLSLGQSSEESNEYISKPSLQSLPTTSASKKYGEINRYVTTGQYFGRGGGVGGSGSNGGSSAASAVTSQNAFISKMLLQRKQSNNEVAPKSSSCIKIKSRRSSAASMCSSYISQGTTRMRRRHRRKSLCMSRSSTKALNIDSKLLTEIEIITTTFHTRCRIQDDRLTASSGKEKLLAEANKLQQTLAAPPPQPLLAANTAAALNASSSSASTSKPLKRALKKRKLSEPLVDFAMLSASAAAASNGGCISGSSGGKRRHKKSGSSPDDHKLPLKKRHYLLTPGERPPADVAAAFAAASSKLNAEAWAAAAAAAKCTASTKSQAQFNARKSALTPKKRHLLQTANGPQDAVDAAATSIAAATSSSPLRIVVDHSSISGGKLLDISPSSLCSLKQQRRQRSSEAAKQRASAAAAATQHHQQQHQQQAMLSSPAGSYPPPGIFEPSVELEIQIPIAKLNEAAAGIITKAEVESPLLALDIKEDTKKQEQQLTRVVETLLHKTGGNLLLKRKRKKINRTGFPTVRRKKRKVSEEPNLSTARETRSSGQTTTTNSLECERVPLAGEARETFVARSSNQRTPRLSVVALERLQGSPRPTTPAKTGKVKTKNQLQQPPPPPTPELKANKPKGRGRKPNTQPVISVVKKRGRSKAAPAITEAAAAPPPLIAEPVEQPPITIVEASLPLANTKLKAKLQASIKLPAGVDPNTNFSCQIRLKRRKNMGNNNNTKPLVAAPPEAAATISEQQPDRANIDAEAAAKYTGVPLLEHEPLPLSEALQPPADYASCSDTSDEKSSNGSRKLTRLKKNYLVAGLFSNYYKQAQMPPPATGVAGKIIKKHHPEEQPHQPQAQQVLSLLPPPPYCERYFRRTQIDFELPYDIWWAYTNAKLPVRHVVPSWNYRKIRTNVYAESVRPNLAGFEHPVCNCKSDAACTDNCLNRMVYTECSPSNCPAGDKCHNQKIQRHEVAPGVERFMTVDKGWGVRTKLPIAKGTYILEYVGEVVTEREFKQRMGTIYFNDTHHYCLHLDGGLVIDGQRMGSDCRFVNHSCEPNCEMQKWSVNGLSRMVLFAKRAIEQGEELTYDYNFSLFNPSEGQPCRCHTPQCRGVIGGKSQRVKPLPAETKATADALQAARNGGRQRKHKARKHAQRQSNKDAAVAVARVQQLSEREKKLVKQFSIFLVRNFEKIRRCKAKRAAKAQAAAQAQLMPARRPSTPSATTLAAQISALCSPRNIKTRGLTQAVQDPEVEKMAKMAVVLRDICNALEALQMPDVLNALATKKKKTIKSAAAAANSASKGSKEAAVAPTRLDFKIIQAQVEQGHYKTPQEYDEQMQQLFAEARQTHIEDDSKCKALDTLQQCYEQQKQSSYAQLLDILGDADALLQGFKPKEQTAPAATDAKTEVAADQVDKEKSAASTPVNEATKTEATTDGKTAEERPATPLKLSEVAIKTEEEDVIRCICGLYKDEGLMIQCAKCMVWQHTECTKADINAENYQCERCEPRQVDREIPLDEYTEEGHRYYLSLMRGDLQVRQGDAVYVLRDIPIKDENGKALPTQKHTYETIGSIDYQECDIFRVEHLWKNEAGKRFIFGHHFLRPHETFHEPSRRFYPNEVVRVSLYEVVPIELVIGRCWVLDRTTFCKGRPMECNDEDHCYICELRVDKTARFFSKAKANHPACTKSYAFRKFAEKLKISKSYAPHDVDPSLLKTKKQKTDIVEVAAIATTASTSIKRETSRQTARQQRGAGGTAAAAAAAVHVITPKLPNVQTVKKKRTRLENVLITMKLKCLDAQTAQEQPIDLSYLLSGRGARQRKTNNSNHNNHSNNNNNGSSHSISPCA